MRSRVGRIPRHSLRSLPADASRMRSAMASISSRPSISSETSLYQYVKRLFDLTVLVVIHLVLLPIWILLWIVLPAAIVLEDGLPVIYKQRRVGRHGREFWLLKFRSMYKDAESLTGAVLAVPNDQRITWTGRVLRATALDELPQVINAFRGDISLVGPRPERPELIKEASMTVPDFEDRLAVRPGLTGLAQVRGSYSTSNRNKLRYDRLYIKNMSLWLDVALLAKSAQLTLLGRWQEGR